jgi:hypothetical protein
MSDSSGDLTARALAAAAAERAEQEKQNRLAQQYEAEAEITHRQEMREDAAKVATEILGCSISPHQWKAHKEQSRGSDGDVLGEYWVAWATVAGVRLVAGMRSGRHYRRHPVQVRVGSLRGPWLTLANFGEALEGLKRQDEPGH